jgi:hypothetical protein
MLNAKTQDLYYIRLGDYQIDFLIQDNGNIIPLIVSDFIQVFQFIQVPHSR